MYFYITKIRIELEELKDLLAHLEVEEIEDCCYRGQSQNVGSPNIFGGQVLAQSLAAGTKTVDDSRIAHSIHSYFFLPGDYTKDVIYRVEKIRDGRSFNTRNVKALQNDKVIYECIISFQKEEDSIYSHQKPMPLIFRKPFMLVSWDYVFFKLKNKLPKN